MLRKHLAATVAAAPLILFATHAFAKEISTATTTPVKTSTAEGPATPGDITVTSAGSITLSATTPAGTPQSAITLDSNNRVTNAGTIKATAVDNVTGITVIGGNAGGVGTDGKPLSSVTLTGTINFDDGKTFTDTDGDGIINGKFAEGAGRFGIKLTGAAYNGDITGATGSSIVIEGNNSGGIVLESVLNGALKSQGTINITGDNAVGLQTKAAVNGNVTVEGGISVLGEGAVGVDVQDNVNGKFVLQGSVNSRGYRLNARPALKADRDKLKAANGDLLQGGGGVKIAGNVNGGILLDRPPVADPITGSTDDTDGDGIKDDKDDDIDGDGVKDAAEGTAVISVMGSAPALAIGSDTHAITVGNVGTTAKTQFGLVVRGTIASDGLFDNVDATGIKIGGANGFGVDMGGGVSLTGTVVTNAYNGDATALHLTRGALSPNISNTGSLTATATVNADATTRDMTVTAVKIDDGANVTTITNTGTINAVANATNATGDITKKTHANAIIDNSGSVTTINNSGVIQARVVAPTSAPRDSVTGELINGTATAIDVSKSTTGVTITQTGKITTNPTADADGDGVADADEPIIYGAVKLGSGADTVDIKNGGLVGDVDFGGGSDTFTIGSTTAGDKANPVFRGALTGSSAGTNFNFNSGLSTVTNTATIQGGNLNVGGAAQLVVTIDPTANSGAGSNTKFDVNSATIGNGAKIGVELKSLITTFNTPTADGNVARYTIIETGAGALTVNGTINSSLLDQNAPFMYLTQAKELNTAGGDSLVVDIRRKTGSELGLNTGETAALDPIYALLGSAEAKKGGITNAFLSATTQQGFDHAYDQLLPDMGEGIFSALQVANQSIARAVATKPDQQQRYGPDSFWIQEINLQVDRQSGTLQGSRTKGFGFVGGYEALDDKGGALGATLAYMNAEEKDDNAAVGEQTSISVLEAGVYWRKATGNWIFAARGAAGYTWFDGDRRFVVGARDQTIGGSTVTIPGVALATSAKWGGYTLAGNLTGGYEAHLGKIFIRPTASLDYLMLSQEKREDRGSADDGSNGLDLDTASRTSSRLTATAEIAVGATFGRDVWWRPEVRLGYRQVVAGDMGDLEFNYLRGGGKGTIQGLDTGEGVAVLGLALRAGTAMSYVAVEGEYETGDGEDRYNLQFAGRMMF